MATRSLPPTVLTRGPPSLFPPALLSMSAAHRSPVPRSRLCSFLSPSLACACRFLATSALARAPPWCDGLPMWPAHVLGRAAAFCRRSNGGREWMEEGDWENFLVLPLSLRGWGKILRDWEKLQGNGIEKEDMLDLIFPYQIIFYHFWL